MTCLQIFSGSLRLQDRATRQSRAVLHARATMDALLFQPEIADHTEERPTAEGFLTTILVRHATRRRGRPSAKTHDEPPEMTLRYLAGRRHLAGRHRREDLHAQEPAHGVRRR